MRFSVQFFFKIAAYLGNLSAAQKIYRNFPEASEMKIIPLQRAAYEIQFSRPAERPVAGQFCQSQVSFSKAGLKTFFSRAVRF